MTFRLEELRVWQKALELANEIDLQARLFPRTELFNQTAQLKRAADSVVSNIAEGSATQPASSFRRYLGIALCSAVEVIACLFIARSRNYIGTEHFDRLHTA